jgi:hypothetical protein
MGYSREMDFGRNTIWQYLYDVAYLLGEIITWEDLEAYICVDSSQTGMMSSLRIEDLKQQYDDVNAAVDSILWNYCCYNIAHSWAKSKGVSLPD